MVVELEDIVKRKNYVLKINWNCSKCGNHSVMIGCVLPGERYYEDRESPLTWEDLLHKKCSKCKHVERPNVVCGKCNTEYEFGQIGCGVCNKEIEVVIELQDSIHVIIEQIRRDKRKKLDTTELEQMYRDLLKIMTDMNYYVCIECHYEFILMNENTKELRCFECNGKQEL